VNLGFDEWLFVEDQQVNVQTVAPQPTRIVKEERKPIELKINSTDLVKLDEASTRQNETIPETISETIPETISYRFNVSQSNALILLNGKTVNSENLIELMRSSNHTIIISAPDHQNVELSFTVNAKGKVVFPSSSNELVEGVSVNKDNLISINLKENLYPVSFITNIDNVSFVIEGIDDFKHDMKLLPGTYQVTASADGYDSINREIIFSDNSDSEQFEFNFFHDLVDVKIKIKPDSNKSKIEFLGEDSQPVKPYRLAKKRYQVKVTSPGYLDKYTTVDVTRKANFSIDLIKGLPQEISRVLENLVQVPSGIASIGCVKATNCDEKERKRQSVTMSDPLNFSHTEITNGIWSLCVKANKCGTPGSIKGSKNSPVTGVTFMDVSKFITWFNTETDRKFRLPSESEWEYAANLALANNKLSGFCRYANYADNSSPYPWKDKSCSDSKAKTVAVVASYAPLAGLYDVFGNVWEMTQTCWNAANPSQNSNVYACSQFTVKGGAYNNEHWRLRPSFRSYAANRYKADNLGFRLVETQGAEQ